MNQPIPSQTQNKAPLVSNRDYFALLAPKEPFDASTCLPERFKLVDEHGSLASFRSALSARLFAQTMCSDPHFQKTRELKIWDDYKKHYILIQHLLPERKQ